MESEEPRTSPGCGLDCVGVVCLAEAGMMRRCRYRSQDWGFCPEHVEIPSSQSSWRCLSCRQLDIGVWSLGEVFMDGNKFKRHQHLDYT